MSGDYTEGIGGLLVPSGALRVIGPVPAAAVDAARAARHAARLAAERLEHQYPGAEVRAVPRPDGDGFAAVVGTQCVTGTVAEVTAWVAGHAPATGAVPGASAAGLGGEG